MVVYKYCVEVGRKAILCKAEQFKAVQFYAKHNSSKQICAILCKAEKNAVWRMVVCAEAFLLSSQWRGIIDGLDQDWMWSNACNADMDDDHLTTKITSICEEEEKTKISILWWTDSGS